MTRGGGCSPPLWGRVKLVVLVWMLGMLRVLGEAVEVRVGVRGVDMMEVDLLLGQVVRRREVGRLEICRGGCVGQPGRPTEGSGRAGHRADARDGTEAGRVTADQVAALLQYKRKKGR